MKFHRVSIARSCRLIGVVLVFAAAPLFAQVVPDPAPGVKPAARLYQQAQTALEAENYAQAIALLQQAVARDAKKVEYQTALADAHFYRAQKLEKLYHFDEAIREYEAAYAIDKLHRHGDAAIDLTYIGGAYDSLSQYERALEYYQQSLVMFREIKDRQNEAITLTNIGSAYSSLSQYELSLKYLQESLSISQSLMNLDEQARILTEIGAVYYRLSEYEEAIEYFRQALSLRRRTKHRAGEAVLLGNIGTCLVDLGRYADALYYQSQSLKMFEQLGRSRDEAISLNNLGRSHYKIGDREKAVTYYRRALEIHRSSGNRLQESITLDNLGVAYWEMKEFHKAVEYFEEALGVRREINDRAGIANTLHNLAKVWKYQRQFSLAVFYGKQSVNMYQTIRASIRGLDTEVQKDYLKSHEDTYRTLADLLIEQGRLPEAQQVLGMLKEEEYFEFVRRDERAAPEESRATLNSLEADWQKRYAEIGDRITAIGAEYGRLDAQRPRTPTEKDARKARMLTLQNDLDVAKKAFDVFFEEVKAVFAKNKEASAQVLNLPETEAMQETLRRLDRKAVVLYTIVGEDDLSVMLLTADALVARKNPQPVPRAQVRKLVNEFLSALKNPKLDPRSAGEALYKVLFCDGKIARDLENLQGDGKGESAPVLMWSLDDVLRYVPMSALYDGKRYLVEKYAQSVFTLGSRDGLREAPQEKWTALGLGVSKEHKNFPALPGVPGELRAVIRDDEDQQSSGPLGGEILLDEKFTEQSFEGALLDHPPLVHIASHFAFRPGNETDSFLLLGDGEPLTLDKIRQLKFGGVDLLTLSACETATSGVDANGKEIEGFGVLAQRGGAGAVLASLWPVADRSTPELMRLFYAAREAGKGESKVEALRAAQLQLLRGKHAASSSAERGAPRVLMSEGETSGGAAPQFVKDPDAEYSHPYYWAPFILIGNWR